MSEWQDINDQQPPAPAHPGAAGARDWVVRRSAELAGREAYSRAHLPAAPVAAAPQSQPTNGVRRLRLWLSTFVYLGVGGTLVFDLLFNRGGFPYGEPSVPILLLGGLGAGFVSSLILRIGRHSNAGSTIGDSVSSLLAANLLAFLSMVVFIFSAGSPTGSASLYGVIEGLVIVFVIIGGSLCLQIPSVLTGVGIGCLLTPRKR